MLFKQPCLFIIELGQTGMMSNCVKIFVCLRELLSHHLKKKPGYFLGNNPAFKLENRLILVVVSLFAQCN